MVDPDAGFTKKNGESYFGYKMHPRPARGQALPLCYLRTLSAPIKPMAAKIIASGSWNMALRIARCIKLKRISLSCIDPNGGDKLRVR